MEVFTKGKVRALTYKDVNYTVIPAQDTYLIAARICEKFIAQYDSCKGCPLCSYGDSSLPFVSSLCCLNFGGNDMCLETINEVLKELDWSE